MDRFRFLLDRTAVLFLGVAAGAAIGFAFRTGNEQHETVVLAPGAAPVQSALPAVAPPPPTGPAAPAEQPEKTLAKIEPVPSKLPSAPPPPILDEQPRVQLEQSARSGKIIHVGVFGDSFGDGVWSALYRLLPATQGYQVVKYSQPSTGFTRYKRLNLEQHDADQLGDQPLEVAVISFGANDAQGVCDGGHCGALMSAFWQQVIEARVQSYVTMLRRHGAAIYWVGLPAMRDAGFDSDVNAMNAFYRTLMTRLGVPFVDIRALTVDGDGRYSGYYDDGAGGQKLLRANDGIHMSMNGYLRVTKALAGRIRDSVGAARTPDADPSQDKPGG